MQAKEKTKLFSKILSSGVKKLLGHLDKVTGREFIDEFIQAIDIIYSLKTSFSQALELQKQIQEQDFSNWFLVTSVDQSKISDAIGMKESAEQFVHPDTFLILNKCLENLGEDLANIPNESKLGQLKESLLLRESKIKEFSMKHFENVLIFDEIIDLAPLQHIVELSEMWNNYSRQTTKVSESLVPGLA